MTLPIYLYGLPVLRKVAEDIHKDHPDLKNLIDNMFETMYRAEGVGLAAPQVGLDIRVIVIDVDIMSDSFPECKGVKITMLNPHIESFDGEEVSCEEGCLSLPGIHESVIRPNKVTVRYFDENWTEKCETFEGFVARAVQHEYDHLEGKVFIDHISPIRKQLIKSKLTGIIKGKARCSYKIKGLSR